MNREYLRSILVAFALLLCGSSYGQKMERKQVREGNKFYNKEKYTEAEIAYRKSFEVNPISREGTYNLGNALYKQGKLPEAAEQYLSLARESKPSAENSPEENQQFADLFHNLGNVQMHNKDYAKSVELYKQSLRFNPKDDETRYNLALAQKLLDDQEQDQDQDQDQDQQNDQQQNQDQQQQQQEQDQQKDQQQEQENKTQEEQKENEQMSRDNAQQLLDAFLQDEKDTQEKVRKAQQKQLKRRIIDKQW